MKNLLLIFAICIFSFVNIHAQVSFKPGLRAGANFSKITNVDADYRAGFYISGIGELKLGKFYTLQPEISYSSQGAKNIFVSFYDYELNENVIYEEDIDFNYVSFSIINKFNFSKNVNFHVGPLIDIIAGRNRYVNSDIDLSFTAGLGYNFNDNLAVEARVKKGIIDVLESDYQYSNSFYEDNYNTNFLFQVGLSYTFDLGN